jgi:hypothetical protein
MWGWPGALVEAVVRGELIVGYVRMVIVPAISRLWLRYCSELANFQKGVKGGKLGGSAFSLVAVRDRDFSTSETWRFPTIPSWISGNGRGSFGWFIHLNDTYEAIPTWCSGAVPAAIYRKIG